MTNFQILAVVIQLTVYLLAPALVLKLEKRSRFIQVISPVLVCYLAGIVMANQDFLPVSLPVSMMVRNVTVALAIPLLLFSVDLIGWLRLSRVTVISFVLCVVSVMITSTIGHFIFADTFEESAKIAGMLVGVYTGGTPNMNAIGTALKIKPEMFIVLESVDMVMGATYLLFLFTLGPRLLAKILPPFQKAGNADVKEEEADGKAAVIWSHVGLSFLLTALIVAAAGGLSVLLPEGMQEAGAILLITTFAIAASMKKRVRALKGSQESGMYVLLIFCVAVGSAAKFDTLVHTSPAIFGYIGFVMLGAIALHVTLAAILRLDRDTVIITSTAGIYGPAFVGPVVSVLKNKEVLISGLASGLVGYSVGNYLGLALAWALG